MRTALLAVLSLIGPGPASAQLRTVPPVAPLAASWAGATAALPPLSGSLPGQGLSLPAPLSVQPNLSVQPSLSGAQRLAAPVLPSIPAATPAPQGEGAALDQRKADRARVTESVWRALEGLGSAREHLDFARAHGIRVVGVSFSEQRLLGLDPDNLAQMEREDGLLYLNWDLIAPDLAALRRAVPEEDALALVALALAPVFAHEVRHARLRAEYGADFPGLREEEILTHADQAEVFDEVLRTHPLAARVDTFLFRHSRAAWEKWRQGFDPLADFVLRKYSQQPSLQDAGAANAARARRDQERLAADPATPLVWHGRIERAIALWEDADQVRRLTGHIQAGIDAVYSRLRRT